MNIQAINGIDSISKRASVSFGQKKSHGNNDSSRTLRNVGLGAAAGLGLTTLALGTTGCQDIDVNYEPDTVSTWSWSNSSSSAWAWACGCRHGNTVIHDTIHHTDTVIQTEVVPIYIDNTKYPYNIADSLIEQGKNVNVKLNGPDPRFYDNVMFIASKAHNRYDNKFYETKVDSTTTSANVLGLNTKVIDLYTDEEKVSYMHTDATIIDGVGVRLDRYRTDANGRRLQYLGHEVRTNLRNGYNLVRVYDKNDNLVLKGKFSAGQSLGTFLYGTVTYDANGNVNINPITGEPEITYYTYDQAEMWSDRLVPANAGATAMLIADPDDDDVKAFDYLAGIANFNDARKDYYARKDDAEPNLTVIA